MIEQMAQVSRPVLDIPFIRRTRRNHALEHATIHMLSRRIKKLSIAGRADDGGFYLYGEVETDTVRECADEALGRMQRGEHRWAVHPNCGTGLVTTSLLTSAAAMIGLAGKRETPQDTFNRLPLVMVLTIGALIVSQPLGLALQEHFTTLGEPGDLEIVEVSRHQPNIPFTGPLVVHRVHTRYG